MELQDPEIFCVTETWLSDKFPNSAFQLDKYQIIRKDRGNGQDAHGGVLIGIKDFLKPIIEQNMTDHEVLSIFIKFNSNRLKVLVAYRPPGQNIIENIAFIDYLKNKLRNTRNCLILGDFNYPDIEWETYTTTSNYESHFLNLVNELSLHQVVDTPTRDNNVLDLILTDRLSFIINTEVHETFATSDHCFITCVLNIPSDKVIEEKYFPNFKMANWELIHAYLTSIDFVALLSSCNVHDMWRKIKQILEFIMNKYIPRKQVTKQKNAPWFRHPHKNMTNKKKTLWKKFKNNKCEVNKRSYDDACKELKSTLRKAKCDYEKSKFQAGKPSRKYFYSYVDRNTKERKEIPTLISSSGEEISTDQEKAEAFIDQYNSVFTIDNGVLPTCAQILPQNTLCILEIYEADVKKSIDEMSSSTACGPDNVHPSLIKQIKCHLIKPLSILFKKCIESGDIPEDFKKATVTPIYKNNRKPFNVSSYRPICLTGVVCKIFERIIRGKLVTYLSQYNLVSEDQHGFMAARSTTTNLLTSINDWTKLLDAKYDVDAFYIDLSKAFDTVVHSKLLYRLSILGIGGNLLRLLESYLTNRTQQVRVNGYATSPSEVVSGIPQGTILGPFLFNVYINDIHLEINFCKVKLYADDSKIYRQIKNLSGYQELNDDIERIETFFSQWQLKVNQEKCEILHLGRTNPQHDYKINQISVPKKQVVRDLGILIGPNLSFSKHVANIVRTAYYRIKQFDLTFTCRDRDFLIFMYITYIRPILESNTQVWAPYHLKDIDELERVQKCFTRSIPGLCNTPYPQRLKILGLDSLEARRIHFDLVLVFKIINDLIDLKFEEFFEFSMASTRGHDFKLNVKYSRLDVRKYFFCNRVVAIWNSLPPQTVEARSLYQFKNKIKKLNFDPYLKGRTLMA